MLSAAEAALEQGAADEAERQRIRAELYRPPKGEQGSQARQAQGMSLGAAQALMAQLAAEDARLTGGK
ncbi:hypothetical protein OG978_32815 [Streptomyces sp. NBC_01591]|uniref:hypothetical protein n=1 Tax=Streptomyces sp. NBC_01591 TaxID=2975888 RepID=UPI002DDADFFC|nr:hypothetical protein [Streptomyces sp. NBC_01591]WSD71757.1 hypothetical protein OG978_32815 [Streptomyces sp. NBC_01591]